MALNLKTLGIRTLSALVFGILLLGSLAWNYITFSIFFFAAALIALKEFYSLCEKSGYRPYKLSGYVGGMLSYLLLVRFDFISTAAAVPVRVLLFLPLLVLSVALFSRRDQQLQNASLTLTGIVYAVLPFGILHSIVISGESGSEAYHPEIILGMILLIWSNDTFAYIGGSLFGKHKMIPRVSPGKTWEGTLTGIILSFALSFLIRDRVVYSTGWLWPVLGIVIPLLATIGDLVESLLKRQAQVKDSGNIMPGHGGVLDRFDSLLFVSPAVVVIMELL